MGKFGEIWGNLRKSGKIWEKSEIFRKKVVSHRVFTQAFWWGNIYDKLLKRTKTLAKALADSKDNLEDSKKEVICKDTQYKDALFALLELLNWAGHAAIKLYKAGQLQERIRYYARNRIQSKIWSAEREMLEERATQRAC